MFVASPAELGGSDRVKDFSWDEEMEIEDVVS